MSLKNNLFKQFYKPSGNLGKVARWLMSVKNKERSDWTVENLKIKPTDVILEIGFGSGATIYKIAERHTNYFICGIDHSDIMYNQAVKKNKKFILQNRIKLECGTIWDLKYPENYFDIIYGSNVHFFWKEPQKEFKKLYSLLKPGGRTTMVFQPRWAKSEDDIASIASQTGTVFEKSGFNNIQIECKKMKPVTCISISGLK